MGKLVRTAAIGAVALAVLAALLFAVAFFPRTEVTERPLTVPEAVAVCPIPLPISATEVYVASSRVGGFAGAHLVRFRAEEDVALSLAQLVIAKYNEGESGARVLSTMPTPIESGPKLPDLLAYRLAPERVPWFDVERIHRGYTLGAGGARQPWFWIDTERGLCYYRMTD